MARYARAAIPAALADELANELANDDRFWRTARDEPDEFPWFAVLVSEMASLVGSSSVDYLSSAVEPADTAVSGRIAVFTRAVFISTTITLPDRGVPSIRTVAVSRKSLVRFESNRSVDTIDRLVDAEGRSVELRYANGQAVTLPLGAGSPRHDVTLAEFTPSLLADLIS